MAATKEARIVKRKRKKTAEMLQQLQKVLYYTYEAHFLGTTFQRTTSTITHEPSHRDCRRNKLVAAVGFYHQEERKIIKFKIKTGTCHSTKTAAVTTNGQECAQIGTDILARNGSAVDAAIAALLCKGIACLNSMGLGRGCFMTIWDAETKTADYLDARETAPAAATRDMFRGNSTLSMLSTLGIFVSRESGL